MKIGTHGRTFTGRVIADRMHKTVTVEWDRRKYIPKFERYAKRKTTVKAHNPEDIDARTGDLVRIKETRRLSKTKNFIVTEVLERGTQKVTETDLPKSKKKDSGKDSKEEEE